MSSEVSFDEWSGLFCCLKMMLEREKNRERSRPTRVINNWLSLGMSKADLLFDGLRSVCMIWSVVELGSLCRAECQSSGYDLYYVLVLKYPGDDMVQLCNAVHVPPVTASTCSLSCR